MKRESERVDMLNSEDKTDMVTRISGRWRGGVNWPLPRRLCPPPRCCCSSWPPAVAPGPTTLLAMSNSSRREPLARAWRSAKFGEITVTRSRPAWAWCAAATESPFRSLSGSARRIWRIPGLEKEDARFAGLADRHGG